MCSGLRIKGGYELAAVGKERRAVIFSREECILGGDALCQAVVLVKERGKGVFFCTCRQGFCNFCRNFCDEGCLMRKSRAHDIMERYLSPFCRCRCAKESCYCGRHLGLRNSVDREGWGRRGGHLDKAMQAGERGIGGGEGFTNEGSRLTPDWSRFLNPAF